MVQGKQRPHLNMITVLIPIYNEEKSIAATIERIKKTLQKTRHEIIAINDGSTDKTAEILQGIQGIRTITHPYNLGYGAALKTGLKNAKHDWILITDADGTYPIESIPLLLEHHDRYDMVVGARSGKNVPTMRKPAKLILGLMANILTGRKIPDLNSGFRLFRKDMALQFMNLYPNGFSFTITITLAALTNSHTVKYIPIEYHKREGKSAINPVRDFIGFMTLILRIMVYFDPLKFFLFPAFITMSLATGLGLYQYLFEGHVTQFPFIALLAGLQILLLGLLAELIVKRSKA
ncbi:glycosyltransferase family 2 protein [Candidatus Woesearchaeota archaeon]|nr:glycosyltransferase family 2 protein [Candidatus Woesearchaeota archaeon]